MKTCPYCLSEIANNAKKCKYCDEIFVEEKKVKLCPYCESEISETAKKCKYCGEWVDESNKDSKISQEDTVNEGLAVEYAESYFASFITGTCLNRIGRAKYMARTGLLIGFWVVGVLIAGLMFNDNAEGDLLTGMMNILGAIMIVAASVFYLYGSVLLRNKRLHDYGYSGRMQLVPIRSPIVLYFMSGTVGKNQYGEHSETKEWEKVLAVIYIIFLIVCTIGVINYYS